MPESTAPDPVELWRELLTQWERSVNDMSNKVMTSGEFSSSANQLTAVVLKIQESLSDVLDKYFRALNLPTRRDVERIDERIMAIEDLLHSMAGSLERLSPRSEEAAHVHAGEAFEPAIVEFEREAFEDAPNGALSHEAHVVPVDVVAPSHTSESTGAPKRKKAPVPAAKTVKRPPRTKRPGSKQSTVT